MGFHSYRVNTGIRTTSSSHFFEYIDDAIDLCVVNCVGSTCLFLRHLQSLRETIYCDDLACPHKYGAPHGHLSHTTTTPDRDNLSRLNITEVGTHIPGWCGIGKEKDLFILQPF